MYRISFVSKSTLTLCMTLSACAQRNDLKNVENPSTQITTMHFHVMSDCPDTLNDLTIEVSQDQIVEPSGTSFIDLGFPTEQVQLGSHREIVGNLDGQERICQTVPSAMHLDAVMTYECSEGESFSCRTTFTKVNDD